MELINNEDKNRFEINIDSKTAFIDYIINRKGVIYLTHTEVPPELEGKGIGAKMVKEVFNFIQDRELKLIPICPFIIAYLKRNPKWKVLLDDNFQDKK